jgi:hypothetical protein
LLPLPCLQLKILGLDICADTAVGGQMLRGVSGGQKKRVTSGELHCGVLALNRHAAMTCVCLQGR